MFRRFSPLQVPGIGLLLEANRIDGLTDDDPLDTYPDLTAFGNNATATGTNRPVYETNVQNGLPGVRFTAANASFMTLGNPATLQFGQTFTAIFVWKTVAATRQTLLGHANQPNCIQFEVLSAAGARNALVNLQGFVASATGAGDGTAAEVLVYRRRAQAADAFDVIRNGVSLAVTGTTAGDTSGNATKELGRRSAGSQQLDGYLFAVAIWPQRALADVELLRVTTYFRQRWGII